MHISKLNVACGLCKQSINLSFNKTLYFSLTCYWSTVVSIKLGPQCHVMLCYGYVTNVERFTIQKRFSITVLQMNQLTINYFTRLTFNGINSSKIINFFFTELPGDTCKYICTLCIVAKL